MMQNFNGGLQGNTSAAYRPHMGGLVNQIKQQIANYIKSSMPTNSFYQVAMKILNSTADGSKRLDDMVVGVINYIDYLNQYENMQPHSAMEGAIPPCVDGFVANIVLGSEYVRELDRSIVATLQGYQNNLRLAAEAVARYITPELRGQMAQWGSQSNGSFGNNPPVRRTGGTTFNTGFGFGSSGGGVDLSFNNNANVQGSLFNTSGSLPNSNPSGGGVNLGIPSTPVDMLPTYPEQQTQSLNISKTINQENRVVTYMNYEEHKTYGIMKAVLPSDTARVLMPVQTIDQNFAAVPAVSEYTKLGNEVLLSDLSNRTTNFSIAPFIMQFGQTDFATVINGIAGEILKLEGKDLSRLSIAGEFLQMFPEADADGKIKSLVNEYNTGMLTHGRLTSMMAELEKIVSPETMIVISKKLGELATNYWRFHMAQIEGDFENYYTGHDDATDYLYRTPDKGKESASWMLFPSLALSQLFSFAPLVDGDGESPLFSVGYIRIPHYAVELPIGIKTDEKSDYGIVMRQATPGLYHLCETLSRAYPNSLHRVLITNDGRLIEVIRPSIGEQDRFFVREMKSLL